MRPAGKTINAFAALREESAILKQKEKKERALERKARKEAGSKIVHHAVPSSIPSSTVMTLQHGYSWADISDDDDEENLAENKCSQEGDNLEAYLSSSEEEASDEDVEGNDPVDGRSNTNEQSDSGSTGRMSDKQQNLYANGIQQSGK